MSGSDLKKAMCGGIGGLTLAVLLAAPQTTAAQQQEAPTYAEDVAPIMNEKCVECHREGSIAPMSLTSYEQARQFAPLIKFRVENRIMPPWHINPTVGIQDFKNDRGITPEQRQTIVQWVDAGAPKGPESAIPPAPDFREGKFWRLGDRLGEPDLVVESPPYDMPAETQDKWYHPNTPTGLEERRWVKAIEIRPANDRSRQVVHHVLAFLEQDEGENVVGVPEAAADDVEGAGLFMEWAVGKAGQIFQPDAGKLMLPGAEIGWELHMHAMGERSPETQVEMGIWFHDTPPEYRTILTGFDAEETFPGLEGHNGESLDIRPGEMSVTQAEHVLPAPARLEGYQPHMHMRGKAMAMEAIYPNGEREVLSFVDNFQWNWHNNYVYADDAAPLLPEGTVLVITAWHDNRPENPNNPDPRQWVGWGSRTIDEMAHAWVDVTYLDQEYFEQLRSEREQRVAEEEQQ